MGKTLIQMDTLILLEGCMGREITGNDMNFSIMGSGVLDM